MSPGRRNLTSMVVLGLTFVLFLPSAAALTWLKLDDPPLEGPGDSLMTTAFGDGFESGNLNQWSQSLNGRWQAAGSRRHTGAYAATVNGGGPPASSTITSLAMDVAGSDRRNVTFWWQLSASTSTIRLALHVFDGGWNNNVWVKTRVDADNTWRKAVVDLTPYRASGSLMIAFEFSSSSGSDRAWVDDVTVARNHPSADMVDLLYSNDGNYLYLQETLVASPDANRYTYIVTLDKPTGGSVVPDFRVVYTKGVSNLQKWNVSLWEIAAPVQVTPGANNLTFRIPLKALANPDLLQDTDLYFSNLFGVVPNPSPASLANPPITPPGVDHAADNGKLHIPSNNVPEVALWPALPILLGALATVVLIRYRRHAPWGGHRR